MRWKSDYLSACELILGIIALIIALPFGRLFDKAAIVYSPEKPLALHQWDKIAREKLQGEDMTKLPNVVQIFHFQNVSSSKDIQELKYHFTVPGQISDAQIRRGSELLGNARWEDTREPNTASLAIDRFPPRVDVTAAILYRAPDPDKVPTMATPVGSASRIPPRELTRENAAIGGALRWAVTGATWLGAVALIVLPYRTLRKRLRESEAAHKSGVKVIDTWERIALDGRALAEEGEDIMYWFKVPLGGICFSEGFGNFLQPALDNVKITNIRFILDENREELRTAWDETVLTLLRNWAIEQRRVFNVEETKYGGRFVESGAITKSVEWIFVDLARENSPSFKIIIDDASTEIEAECRAQVFLALAQRKVEFDDGELQDIQIPLSIVRVEGRENSHVLQSLSSLATQWDSLFGLKVKT